MKLLASLGILLFSSASASAAPHVNYEEVLAFMHDLAAKHPRTTHLVNVGPSDSGKTIEALVIGDGPVKNLVVATHHGNEYGSTFVAEAFASAIADNPIAGQTLFVIPVLNVNGYDRRSRYEDGSDGGGHDPNRDYPGACGTEGPHKLKSTASLAGFVDREGIVASATLHTFYPAVVYPWGFATKDLVTPYEDLFKYLVAMATQESGYQTGNSTEVIYPAAGTFEDYAFWKHGIWSILFELGRSHNPNNESLAEMARVNVPGLRRLFEKSPDRRADDHAFKGKCDTRMIALDRHDE
jgi:hypothetical protein